MRADFEHLTPCWRNLEAIVSASCTQVVANSKEAASFALYWQTKGAKVEARLECSQRQRSAAAPHRSGMAGNPSKMSEIQRDSTRGVATSRAINRHVTAGQLLQCNCQMGQFHTIALSPIFVERTKPAQHSSSNKEGLSTMGYYTY